MITKYRMKNRINGATTTTIEPYLLQWIARGFEVIEIIREDEDTSTNEEEIASIQL